MSNNISVDLEQQTEACCNCDSEDEKFCVVVTRLGKPADHFCLSCISALHAKLDRVLREVPTL